MLSVSTKTNTGRSTNLKLYATMELLKDVMQLIKTFIRQDQQTKTIGTQCGLKVKKRGANYILTPSIFTLLGMMRDR